MQRNHLRAALLVRARRVAEAWAAALGEVAATRIRARLATLEELLRAT